MAIYLTNTIRDNRTNTKVTPMDLYGTNGKTEWNTFLKALYDWSVLDTDANRDAAFEAGRVIMAHFNEELPKGRKIKFEGMEDMLQFRDSATKDRNVDTDEARQLKAVKSFCLYRTGEVDKVSFAFCDIWDRWHLNDMRPYCEHQRAAGWDELAKEEIKLYHYSLTNEASKEQKVAEKAAMIALKNGEAFTPTADQAMYAALPYFLDVYRELTDEEKKYYKGLVKFCMN